MDTTIAPVPSSYAVTPATAYADNVNNVSTYEQLIELEDSNDLSALGVSSSSGSGSSTAESSLPSADLLNLSPAALNILNGIEGVDTALQVQNAQETGLPIIDAATIGSPYAATPANAEIAAIIAAYNSSGETVSATVTGINGVSDANIASADATLANQQQIANIVAQFSTAPLNATTVAQINTALSNAGINPQQLSLQEILVAYAAFVPTQNYSDTIANSELSDELLDA